MSKQRAMAVAEIAVMVRMGYPPLLCAMQLCPPGVARMLSHRSMLARQIMTTRISPATMAADVIGAGFDTNLPLRESPRSACFH
jgi:hypothetical protein